MMDIWKYQLENNILILPLIWGFKVHFNVFPYGGNP